MVVRDGVCLLADGMERFDSFAGLFSTLEALLGKRLDGAPKDTVIQNMDGRILGQKHDAGYRGERSYRVLMEPERGRPTFKQPSRSDAALVIGRSA